MKLVRAVLCHVAVFCSDAVLEGMEIGLGCSLAGVFRTEMMVLLLLFMMLSLSIKASMGGEPRELWRAVASGTHVKHTTPDTCVCVCVCAYGIVCV